MLFSRPRRCMRLPEATPLAPETNNPNAHVLRRRMLGSAAAKPLICMDLITDQWERRDGEPFQTDDVLTREGDDWRSERSGCLIGPVLSSGLQASANGVHVYGSDHQYRLDKSFAAQPKAINDWYDTGAEGYLLFCSICPGPEELPASLARRMNFKPERLLSVNSLYRRVGDQIVVTHFSLDGHTLANHGDLLNSLGCSEAPADTTVAEAARGHIIKGSDDPLLQMKRFFNERPADSSIDVRMNVVLGSYFEFLEACDKSEQRGRVSAELGRLTRDLEITGYRRGSAFDAERMRVLLHTLRSQSYPHFLQGSSDVSLSVASGEAVGSGTTYDGICPDASVGSISSAEAGGYVSHLVRHNQTAELRNRLAGYSSCTACGARTFMYGCGVFCRTCNNVWCDAYESPYLPRQLSAQEIRTRRGLPDPAAKARRTRPQTYSTLGRREGSTSKTSRSPKK